jgi:predicted ATPase with chaperone activity
LPDKSVEESRERIAAAIKNSGTEPPHKQNKRVIINLAPADLEEVLNIKSSHIAEALQYRLKTEI